MKLSPVKHRIQAVKDVPIKHIVEMQDRYAVIFETFFENQCAIEYDEHRGEELIYIQFDDLTITYNVYLQRAKNEKTGKTYRNSVSHLYDMLRCMDEWLTQA